MKYLIIFISIYLFAFEVEFTESYKKIIDPNIQAILLETKKPIQINYSPKIYTKKGIVLLNYDNADQFVRNDLYFNGNIKDVKIGIFNIDEVRSQMILKIDKYYKNCKLKKIVFKDNNIQSIYFTPKNINLKAIVTLDCKH